MLFREITEYFDKIESASSRLVMASFLAELLGKIDENEIKKIIYIMQGQIAPTFEGKEIGFGEKLIADAISKSTGYPRKDVDELFNKTGDMGETAEQLTEKKKQGSLFTQELSLEKVFDNFKKMARAEGKGSQESKKRLLAELFNSSNPTEAKYIARIPIGNIRLGIGDSTIMDSLAEIFVKEGMENKDIVKAAETEVKEKKEEKRKKELERRVKYILKERIEGAYNVYSDLGEIAELLKKKGIKGLEEIEIHPGTPIRPTAAERLPSSKEIIAKLGKCAVEAKYDGFRCIGGHTMIYEKEKGLISVKDIKKNDYVLTHKGKFKKVLAIQNRIIDKGEKVYELQPYLGNKFKITENHKIQINRNKKIIWEKIDNIKKTDLLVFPKPNLKSDDPPKKIDLETLDCYKKTINFSDDFYRFIGYWIGDGFTNEYHNTERIGLIFNKKDTTLCDYYETLVKKLFKIKNVSRNVHNGAIYLYWRDAPFRKWLTKNFRREWRGKLIPEWFYGINKKQFSEFLEGWTESDGTTDNLGRSSITTKERDLCMRAQLLGLKHGKIIGIKKFRAKSGNNEYTYYKLILPKNDKKSKISKNVFLTKILKYNILKNQKKLRVYNLHIEGDNSYCTPLLAIHNCQISKDGDNVKIFSRQSEDITNMFPEIIEAVKKDLKVENCVVEGEALAVNKSTNEYYPFQITIQRKRKYEVEKKSKEYPLNLFLFDIMYLNGKSTMKLPFKERRKKLESIVGESDVINLSEMEIIDDPERMAEFFEEKITQGLEGIIAKDLNAPYIAGARKFAWIKLKRSYKGTLQDTVDAVIIGYFSGKGKRTQFGLGALLVAVYNKKKDVFESIAKIGTGMTEDKLVELEGLLSKIKSDKKPARVESKVEPDFWVDPKYVVETRADEITKSPMHVCCMENGIGLALRFPRMISLRSDKSPEEATTSNEVNKMFKIQKRVDIENPYSSQS